MCIRSAFEENLLAPLGICKILMIRSNLSLEEWVCLHSYKVLHIVEMYSNEGVVVGHVSELGIEELAHHSTGGRQIMCLLAVLIFNILCFI